MARVLQFPVEIRGVPGVLAVALAVLTVFLVKLAGLLFQPRLHIAAFFKEIGRADELGSGTRNLYHYTRLYSGTDPIIDEEDAFSVTVPLNDDYSPEVGEGTRGNDITQASIGDDTVNGTVNDTVSGPLSGLKSGLKNGPLSGLKSGLNETDSKLIGFIQSNPSVTIQELQAMLNLSRNGVRKALGRLKATGLLRRIGPDKGGHWEVLER